MGAQKRIGRDEKVAVRLAAGDRSLIVNHTFADESLTDRFQDASVPPKHGTFYYTIDELDELMGFVAAEANHATDRRLQDRLDALFDKLMDVLDIVVES